MHSFLGSSVKNLDPEDIQELRIATYNIHRCRGMDRRTLPRRIAEVLYPLHTDVIALQEVLGAGPKWRGQDE